MPIRTDARQRRKGGCVLQLTDDKDTPIVALKIDPGRRHISWADEGNMGLAGIDVSIIGPGQQVLSYWGYDVNATRNGGC